MSQFMKAVVLSLVFGVVIGTGVILNVFEVEGDGHSHSHGENVVQNEGHHKVENGHHNEDGHTH